MTTTRMLLKTITSETPVTPMLLKVTIGVTILASVTTRRLAHEAAQDDRHRGHDDDQHPGHVNEDRSKISKEEMLLFVITISTTF